SCPWSDGAADVARLQELLVALAAHLRAHAVEAVPGGRAELEHPVDVEPGLDQAAEIPFPDQILLFRGEPELRQVGFLVGLERIAVLRIAQRVAELVQAASLAREPQIEDRRVRNRGQRPPHTSFAVSMHSRSFAFSCSTVRLLPWWVLEKPHCGERHRFSSGTTFEACSILLFRASFVSSSGTLDDTRPSTTRLPFGM